MATLAELFDAIPAQAWGGGQPGDAGVALTATRPDASAS
jgi:hypothetical protein